mmetsp:Transcript_14321/g.21445  ORF Transcript_14321/g.21445 Transcript_14321/m.21445 type:complete len:157 (+) Transcript_14321:58-528(+)
MVSSSPCRPFFLLLSLSMLPITSAETTLGYATVLIIVIVELTFAFGVGLGCILFSFNLVRSVYGADAEQTAGISAGQFPRAKESLSGLSSGMESTSSARTTLDEPLCDYNTFDGQQADALEALVRRESSDEVEPDNTQNRNVFAILKTFTDYMRIF